MLAQSTKEISDLSETQADSMKQLEEGVEQIAEVIQNNSAAAQETSATSEELSAQASRLCQHLYAVNNACDCCSSFLGNFISDFNLMNGIFNQFSCINCCCCTVGGQFSNLVCDNGKSSSGFASPCSFYGSV